MKQFRKQSSYFKDCFHTYQSKSGANLKSRRQKGKTNGKVSSSHLEKAAFFHKLKGCRVDVQLGEVHRLLHLLLLPLPLLVQAEVTPHGHLLVGVGRGRVLCPKVPARTCFTGTHCGPAIRPARISNKQVC